MPVLLARVRFAIDHRWAPGRMSAFLDDDLRAGERARMERHLHDCHECRRLLAGLDLVVAALHRLPVPAGGDPSRIAASVRGRLNEPGSP
jgi:anti-sigma factor RsiW